MKRILSVCLCVVLVLSLAPAALAEGVSFSLPNIQGGTVTQDTYKDKVQLLVFIPADSSYAGSFISGINKSFWIDNPNIQVIVVDCSKGASSVMENFKSTYAPGVSKIVFSGGGDAGYDLMWQLHGYGSLSYNYCAIIKDGELVESWDACNDTATCEEKLRTYVPDMGTDPDIATASVTGIFLQSDCRETLEELNAFRTGPDAWYWNEDNTTKTYFNQEGGTTLQPLAYDYGLEKVAMLRAAEIAVAYIKGHIRPVNAPFYTAKVDGLTSSGENMAYGQPSAYDVYIAWREDDEPYAGQGHRRNMLNEDFTCVGLAGFVYNGVRYWVQEFGYKTTGVGAVDAQDGPATMDVSYSISFMESLGKKTTVTLDPNGGSVGIGSVDRFVFETYGNLPAPEMPGFRFVGWRYMNNAVTADTPLVVGGEHTLTAGWTSAAESVPVSSVELNYHSYSLDPKYSTTSVKATVLPENADTPGVVWTSSDPTVVSVSQNGRISALNPGFATVTASAGGASDSLRFQVYNTVRPVISSAEQEGSSAVISWSPVPGQEEFIVSRSSDGGASWTDLAAVKELSFTDTTAQKDLAYMYRIIYRNPASYYAKEVISEPVELMLTDEGPAAFAITGLVASFNPRNPTSYALYEWDGSAYNTEAAYSGTLVESRDEESQGMTPTQDSFAIRGVAPGTYKLVITKASHISFEIRNLVISGDLDLTADAREAVQSIRLACGDVDEGQDQKVNLTDLNMVLRNVNYLRGVDDAANPACDLNGDLKVNLTDLNIILASYNYLRGAQDFIFE
ncbi:MAG: Ig-like domain-containing protein [Oscillospiraceae bacterium]|nr:Ig-like domain-containing protein [Oscillospiraceae bacterium]